MTSKKKVIAEESTPITPDEAAAGGELNDDTDPDSEATDKPTRTPLTISITAIRQESRVMLGSLTYQWTELERVCVRSRPGEYSHLAPQHEGIFRPAPKPTMRIALPRDPDISLPMAGVLVIMGPTGAGKSTLVNSMLDTSPSPRRTLFMEVVEDGSPAEELSDREQLMSILMDMLVREDGPSVLITDSLRELLYSNEPHHTTMEGGLAMGMLLALTSLNNVLIRRNRLVIFTLNPSLETALLTDANSLGILTEEDLRRSRAKYRALVSRFRGSVSLISLHPEEKKLIFSPRLPGVPRVDTPYYYDAAELWLSGGLGARRDRISADRSDDSASLAPTTSVKVNKQPVTTMSWQDNELVRRALNRKS